MGAGNSNSKVTTFRDFNYQNPKANLFLINLKLIHPVDSILKLYKLYNSFGNEKVQEAVVISDPRRRFALKTIRQNKFQDIDAFLSIELPMLCDASHPNLVRHYEGLYDEKQLYIIMEACDGGSVKSRMEQHEFNEVSTRHVLLQILKAVKFLHEHGIAHRNIKVDNILFKTSTENDVKLGGFRHSKCFAKHASLEMAGSMGTLSYSAPEVFKGQYNEKCDIWSLGIVMYVMMTGGYPFELETSTDLKKSILNEKLVLNQGRMKTVGKEAKDLLKRLLEKDPKKRWSAGMALQHKWFSGIQEEQRIAG